MAKRYTMDRALRLYVKAGIREGRDVSEMVEYLAVWYGKGKISDDCFEELMTQLEEYEAAREAKEKEAPEEEPLPVYEIPEE